MIKSVDICGIPHSVEYVDDVFGNGSNLGQIEYAKCKISILKDMPSYMTRQSLCHEILHGMLVNLGYNNLSEDETFVQSLAQAINQTFTIKEGSLCVSEN